VNINNFICLMKFRSNRRPHESDWRKRVAEKDPPCLAETRASWHGSQRSDFFLFPPTRPPPRQISATISPQQPVDPSSSLFLTLGGRKKKTSQHFIPRCFRNKQNLQVSQETRTETSRRRRLRRRVLPPLEPYNNKPLRPRLICPSITSCVCRSQASPANLVLGAERGEFADQRWYLTPSVRFDLLTRPAGLVVSWCDCCDCFVSLRQATTLILEFCSIGWLFSGKGIDSFFFLAFPPGKREVALVCRIMIFFPLRYSSPVRRWKIIHLYSLELQYCWSILCMYHPPFQQHD